MRTVASGITTPEASAVHHARAQVVASDELISFAAYSTTSATTVLAGVPQTYAASTATEATRHAVMIWRTTDGKSYARSITPSTAATWAFSTSGAVQLDGTGAAAQYHAMRYGLDMSGGNDMVYAPLHDASGIQLKRSVIGTWSPASYGPVFGPVYADGATLIRRVEAICPTAGGIIVAIGTHDFTLDLSTIQFWLVVSNTFAVQLDAIIQQPNTETYSSWYGNCQWASFVTATYDATAKSIRVVANGHIAGQAVGFSVTAGVCTPVLPVIPVDPTYSDATFRPSAITAIGSLYLLAGRITYNMADGSSVGRDVYLTSADGAAWSIGERNYLASSADQMGTIVLDDKDATVRLYYAGNGTIRRADATPALGYNTTAKQLTLTPLPGWDLSQGTGAPDKLNIQFANNTSALTGEARLKGGSLLTFKRGQSSTFADVGIYCVKTPSNTVMVGSGRLPLSLTAEDAGRYTLSAHNAPITLDAANSGMVIADLSTDDDLMIKTREDDIYTLGKDTAADTDLTKYDALLGSFGLKQRGINNPLIAYADVDDSAGSFMRATVSMPDSGSTYALPCFALLFQADDDGAFQGVIVPKTNLWPVAPKAKAYVVYSNLAPYDEADDTGGFVFEKRYQGLWSSNNYDAGDAVKKYLQATLAQTAHYVTQPDFTHAPGEIRDYVLLRNGPRVTAYSKAHDFAPATCSTNAGYTQIVDYLYGEDTKLTGNGKTRMGIATSIDSWASKQAFDHAAYGDQELSFTSATSYETVAHYSVVGTPASVHHFGGANAENTAMVAVDAGGYDLNIDLRNYFYPGQVIYIDAGVGFATIGYLDNHGGSIYNWVHFTQAYHATTGSYRFYLRAGAYWAEASSASASKTILGSTIWLDPKPVKTIVPLIGWGTFIGNNPSDLVYDDGWIQSDGVTHYRMDKGWDPTNPIALPNDWKLIFHHNAIGLWRASTTYGLATSGHMIVENEIVRYNESQYQVFSDVLGNGSVAAAAQMAWITHIPTHYAYPLKQASASQTIYNKIIEGEDDFYPITNAAGLLCEITGRSAGTADSDVPNVYVTGNGKDGSNRGYVTIDTMPAGPILDTDFVTLSGRAQMGTKLDTHPSEAIVCNYPVPVSATPLTAPFDSFITITDYEASGGIRMSAEDALKRLCAFAGVRKVYFRNLMTGAHAKTNWTATLTTTPQALPLVSDLSDFELQLAANLTDNGATLRIDFRNYYRLMLKQASAGNIFVGLATTSTDIDTDSGGVNRWLERTAATGLGLSNIDLCPTAGDNANIRMSVEGDIVRVDVNGCRVWEFNVARYVHTDGTSYAKYTAGPIELSYSASVAGNSASARVPELWASVEDANLASGSNTMDSVTRVLEQHHAVGRATQDGGIEFGQFIVRDDAGTMTRGVVTHEKAADASQLRGHVMAKGDKSGVFFNDALIAAEGYSYAAIDVDNVKTVQRATAEAQLYSREGAEFAHTENVDGFATIADQPEDMKTLEYTPTNGAPTQAAEVCTITAIEWTGGVNEDTANYKMRVYQSWQ